MTLLSKSHPLVIYGVLCCLVFSAAFAFSYVYSHDPQYSLVDVDIAHSISTEPRHTFVEGTVVNAGRRTVIVKTKSRMIEVALADIVLEELQPLTNHTTLSPGMPINIGGGRSDSNHVLNGIVIFDLSDVP